MVALVAALELIGLALGGEAGARLARALGMTAGASADTLLRVLEALTGAPSPSSVRVLGVGDWAWRKGQRDGPVLVDLERHRRMVHAAVPPLERPAHPLPRRAAWLLCKAPDALTAPEAAYVDAVAPPARRSPPCATSPPPSGACSPRTP